MNHRAKKILITAGPTWVRVDPVRVIGNTASGETGLRLAHELVQQGAQVTLLLGPVAEPLPDRIKGIRIIRFRFFDELARLFDRELHKPYDAVIHSAAVADYRPRSVRSTKITSDRTELTLRLVRTPKLIERIRRVCAGSFSVGFKFEPGASRAVLFQRARALLQSSRLDLVVANTVERGAYRAWLVHAGGISGPLNSKQALIRALVKTVTQL